LKNTVKYFSRPYYFDKDELKTEYRSLSKQYHPDIGGSNEVMALINAEYDILKNEPVSRQFKVSKPRRKAKSKTTKHEQVFVAQEIITLLEEWDVEYWIDGDMVIADKGSHTYEMRDELKNVGFWWDAVNKYWYWVESHSKRKFA